MDDLPPVKVGFEGLAAPPDGAQRAKEMLHAQAGTVQPDAIDRWVMAKHQVIAAGQQPRGCRLMVRQADDIIGNIEST